MTISTKYPDYTCTFADVYLAELNYVKKRREKMALACDTVEQAQQRISQELEQHRGRTASDNHDPQDEQERLDVRISSDAGLVGLAISGGGIRSATFNLGLLQALDKKDILRYCDYMSTVSGGGYIGSCLSSLLTNPKATTDCTVPNEKGDFPFRFLRDSESDERREVNYELPAETSSYEERREISYLRAAKNYLGLNSNLLSLNTWRAISTFLSGIALINIVPIAIALLVASLLFLLESPVARYTCATGDSQVVQQIVEKVKSDKELKAQFANGKNMEQLKKGELPVELAKNHFLVDAMTNNQVQFHICSYSQIKNGDSQKITFSQDKTEEALSERIMMLLKLAFFAFLGMVMVRGFTVLTDSNNRILTGLQALFLATTVVLIVTIGLITFAYYIFANAADVGQDIVKLLNYILLTSLVFFFLGRLNSENQALQFLLKLMLYLAFIMLIPIIFAHFLYLLWVTELLRADVSQFSQWFLVNVLLREEVSQLTVPIIGTWPMTVVIATVLLLISLLVNINNISLHAFYRDGLRGTYIIKRKDDETIQPNGDLKLTELHQHDNGPYHLINTTLNIMGSKHRDLKGRGADYFIFSKLYCGSESTGYRSSITYNQGKTELATVMAISGAAASPKMGRHTNRLLGLYMILFNIRMNVWMPNPNPKYEKFPIWPYYFLKEFFPLSKEQDSLLNLSDGGHHENLGIYPLIKRRCKLILVSDCGADPNYLMDDLANLQRKARIDFGINIDLDLTPLRPNQQRFTERYWVKGIIHYPNDTNGILIFIKTTMTGKEPEDLLAYRRQSPSFPDETTANQFFQEDQFESYRKLGEVIGKEVSDEIRPEIDKLFGTLR
jgi:hypothetical protein